MSNRLKERKIRTTHSVEMHRRAQAILAKPEEKRTDIERSILADVKDEERGIRTLTEVQTMIRENQAQPEPPKENLASGIVEQKAEKEAPVVKVKKQSVNKKPSIVKVKHGKKKSA
ncbi:MAG: hypothetical protein WC455_27600 [Dehalococcoidia bacterium]